MPRLQLVGRVDGNVEESVMMRMILAADGRDLLRDGSLSRRSRRRRRVGALGGLPGGEEGEEERDEEAGEVAEHSVVVHVEGEGWERRRSIGGRVGISLLGGVGSSLGLWGGSWLVLNGNSISIEANGTTKAKLIAEGGDEKTK